MPAGYAHYRFGTQLLPQLGADTAGILQRHRAIFDMGVQGPDFLFFHSFFRKTPLYRLGHQYHEISGREFFTQMCARTTAQPSEDRLAYLTGLLAHYCLDSSCHPFVYAMTENTATGHSELETEFDRYLMTLDGIRKPHETNISRHLRLNRKAYDTVAGFFPEITAKDAKSCIRSMALSQKLLTLPTSAGHKAVELFTGFAGGNTGGMVMTVGPDPRWAQLDEPMLNLYEQSLKRFPALFAQLSRHMAQDDPFGDDFNANFNHG